MPIDDPARKAAVARLVASGNMTREDPGQFTEDFASADAADTIPDYDSNVVRKALPHILEMNFDEDETGCFAVVRDGTTGEAIRIPFGADPPANTDALIEAIHAHYRGQLDTDALDETSALFDQLEGED